MPFTNLLKLIPGKERGPGEPVVPNGAILVKSADELLSDGRISQVLEKIRGRVSLPDDAFDRYYLSVIKRYAVTVQSLPASRFHHHAFEMGLLLHTLEVIEFALRRKERYAIPPETPPENADETVQVWIWGIFAAGILHDLGKSVTDVLVVLYDREGKVLGRWSPYQGPMNTVRGAHSYQVKFNPSPDYHYHTKLNSALMMDVVPRWLIDWISRERKLFSYFLSVLSGDYAGGNLIGEIVQAADSDSTSRSLGAEGPARIDKSAMGLQDKILQSIRYLLTETSKLAFNRPGAAGFVKDGYLYVVSKRFVELLREQLMSDGHTNVPGDNNRMFSVLQEHGIVVESSSGKAIWKGKVVLQDDKGIQTWDQDFTLLKLNLGTLLPDKDLQPPEMRGLIQFEDVQELAAPSEANPSNQSEREVPADKTDKEATESKLMDNTGGQTSVAKSAVVNCESPEDSASQASREGTVDKKEPVGNESSGEASRQQAKSYFEEYSEEESDVPEPRSQAENSPKALDQTSRPPAEPGKESSTLTEKEVRSQAFVEWLRASLANKNVSFNSSNALVHVVVYDGEKRVLLMSPKVFKQFGISNELEGEWTKYQKAFLAQRYHLPNAAKGQTNFIKFGVKANRGPDKEVAGVVVRDWRLFFDSEPPKNDMLYPK